MEHDIKSSGSLLLKICRWYLNRHFSESNAAGNHQEKEGPTSQGIFQSPVLTIVFREERTEEDAIREIADIYINRHSYSSNTETRIPEEKEYLKFENINFNKLEKINI